MKSKRPASWSNNDNAQCGLTQTECALLLGVTRERIGQIERSALTKMRKLVKPEFREFLEG